MKKLAKNNKVPEFLPILLAFLLGVGLCVIVINNRPLKEPVYLLAEVDIKDYEEFAGYARKASEIIAAYGGKYIVRGGHIMPMEGNWTPKRIVLVEFGNIDQLKNCFNSPAYLEIKPQRDASSTSRAVILSGYRKR